MSISQTMKLSKPKTGEPIKVGTLSYFRARNKHRLHSIVLDEFKNSGISQAELARRLRKQPDVVCRFLAAPGNWELDTVSDYIFAMRGGEISYGVDMPLDKPARNYTSRDQFQFSAISKSTTGDVKNLNTNNRALQAS